ncbi:hypothetical protein G3I78_50625, partial [Streptomyces sp. SID13726]|nr:hypothetical protein [Streptomyces sp. SID13726]
VLVDTDRLEQCFPAIDYFESRNIPFVVGVNCFDGVAKHKLEDVREAQKMAMQEDRMREQQRRKGGRG